MQGIATICLDIAQSVFQVHGVNAEGKVALCRQLERRYVLASFHKLPCPVGFEADVKLHKSDAVDAEAICVAVTTANMRFSGIEHGT
jgi:transposase